VATSAVLISPHQSCRWSPHTGIRAEEVARNARALSERPAAAGISAGRTTVSATCRRNHSAAAITDVTPNQTDEAATVKPRDLSVKLVFAITAALVRNTLQGEPKIERGADLLTPSQVTNVKHCLLDLIAKTL
jgi:hypothetical protein